jgi:alcohol dehydrogenase
MNERSSSWSYSNPVRIASGAGSFGRLRDLAPATGTVLLVTTAGFTRRGLTARIRLQLGEDRVLVHDSVTPNPELADLDHATVCFKAEPIRCIVALGGGSVMDVGKTLSVTLACDEKQPLHHVLRMGREHVWCKRMPVIAIPTTSGTGAEVTPFATIWDTVNHKKYSVAGEHVFPTHALIDPELTVTLPAQETLHTALDAISHALESLWNKNRTPISTAYSIQAITMAQQALPLILQEPGNLAERGRMQHASLLAGLAISQTRTAIAHSISYPLTTHFGVPHGLACSFTLPVLLKANIENLARQPHERNMLSALVELLDKLDLGSKIKEYASTADILALQGEMSTPGRADNFTFAVDINAVLTSTLER